MNHEDDTERELIARLRASDPAVAVEPREGFADAVVAHAMADSSTSPTGEVTSPVVALDTERARRRPGWLPLVAVAASLAVFGAGGYGIGASLGATTHSADGAAPPISLQSGEGMGGVAPEGAGISDASGGPLKTSGYGASDAMYPYGFGRNTFSSSGLSTSEGSALAYSYDARAASKAENVAALAAALGVVGTPELKDGSWIVGPQDGTSSSVSVSLDGALSFYFANQLLDPWQCGADATSTEPCEPPSDLPSEEAAIAAMRSLIESLGRDSGAFEYSSESWEGAFTRTAQAWPVVDGQRLDQPWSLELTADGIYSANGALAGIVQLGDYAIVSEQEGFERLSDSRFGAQMNVYPFAVREAMDDAPVEWVPPTEPPATPGAGTSLSWPVNDVEIVSARLGLASQWQPDGSIIIVPAYEFTDANGGIWSVIAVADSKLDFAIE